MYTWYFISHFHALPLYLSSHLLFLYENFVLFFKFLFYFFFCCLFLVILPLICPAFNIYFSSYPFPNPSIHSFAFVHFYYLQFDFIVLNLPVRMKIILNILYLKIFFPFVIYLCCVEIIIWKIVSQLNVLTNKPQKNTQTYKKTNQCESKR